MIALSHSTSSNSWSGARQLTRTSDREVTVFCVTAAVKAHAACSKASAGVLPHPRMPMSASCAKCSHLAIRAACTELMIQALKQALLNERDFMRMCQVFCGKIGLVDHCVDLGGERVEGLAEGVAIDRRAGRAA